MASKKHSGPCGPVLFILVTACAAWSQTATPAEFEVVSIKPTPNSGDPSRFAGCRGGPGTSDPGLITCSRVSAGMLVRFAHPIGWVRVIYTNPPGTKDPQFEIAAKVPHGATEDQVHQMWQKFLKDRFQLAVHRETREVPVYELVVAKGGFKAKEWGDRPADPDAVPWEPGKPVKRDAEGFPKIPPGKTINFFTGEKAWFVAPAGGIDQIATMLETRLSIGGPPKPVIDSTGLTGKYDLKFWWSPAADHPTPGSDDSEGPSMLSALESQLGLKVQQKKSAPVEMLIIDHLEANPTEN